MTESEEIIFAFGQNFGRSCTETHLVKKQYALEEENRIGTKHLDFVRDQVASIRNTWDFLTEQERQMVIRDCVYHINIYKDRVEIFYTFVKKEGAGTKAA